MSIAVSPTPVRHFPVIRVFVSSTFSDLVAERNALAEKVWPELEKYCRQRGFTFQAIDLRWGVPSEAGLDHRTMQICFEELHRAQEASPEPNFLILLGNKYGWRPLPETISETEYARLFEHTQSPDEQDTLADWYRRDGNARPPHHILRARTDSPDGQDYTRVGGADGRPRDVDAWLAVQETLWAIVNRAYPGSLLDERFADGTANMPASVRFQGSATEQEIWHGALRGENARDRVVAWFREIDRTRGNPEPSHLKQFMDLRPDQSPDPDAADALAALKTQVEHKLAPEPILHAQCRWETDANGAFTGEVTSDHLAPMCETILTRLRALILRQINEYWGADLSAEDATVAVVRGTQKELDLELRDHKRFARERGPVDGFFGRDEQVRALRDYLQATTNRPLIVHGPSGSGKTALLAYVAQQPFQPGAEARGVSPLILTRFIGAHPESSTLRGLMTSLCRELRVHFPIPEPFPDTLQKLIEEFYTQLARATAEQPIYVFLDALDQLEAADQARECFWLRSQILPQAGEAPCHARIVASCLSPSVEFPPESEACVPFRRLQSRGLLADEELGALSETEACELLRRWLAGQHRGLTDEQWQHVDAALRKSSERRQPLYLRTLLEQLRGRREFDELMRFPASLSQLIQETLTRLCQQNQHGALAEIALAYLVSASYGLSEAELLEVLLRDPGMQALIGEAAKNYGHSLPPNAKSYPIAPWARLRSDLRTYLSERAAPGTTVLSCYHRQVKQAVRRLFLADDATRAQRRLLLADYFDTRWDQPDAHALMELPGLLLALPDHRRLHDRLTNFAFPMRKAEVGLLDSIPDDYSRLGMEGSADIRDSLAIWQDFFREQGYLLRRGVADKSVHQILLQLALEHANDSAVTTAAETWLSAGRCDWLRLQRVPRLKQLSRNACLAVLEGHTEYIGGVLPLPGGRILSWADRQRAREKTLRLWDVATGACLAILDGHTEVVLGALLLPDGRILSWGDTTPRLWNAATGACLAVLEGHTKWVQGALALLDGRILTWSGDTTLRLWDATTGVCCSILTGHTGSVKGALVLPNGRILSWVDFPEYDTLRLWDAATGACLAVLEGHTSRVKGALPLPDGGIVSWSSLDARGRNDTTLRVWDVPTGVCRATLKGHTGSVKGALPLLAGRILSWGDEMPRLWDAVTGACLAVLEGHKQNVLGVILLPDGRILSWGDEKLRLWDAATGALLAALEGHTSRVNGARTLPDGQILSWSGEWMSGDYTLRVWDAATQACLAVMQGHTDGVTDALVLSNGRILSWSGHSCVLGEDKTLRLWDPVSGACLAVLDGHTKRIDGALLLPDGLIVSWAADDLRLWDVATRGGRATPERHIDTIKSALALPGGRILSCGEKTVRLWDASTGTCLTVYGGHNRALALPGGQILSWGDLGFLEDKTLRLWDAASGACLAVLKGHTYLVNGALLLPDGRILSWGDTTLRLWDAASGASLSVLEGHTEYICGVLPLPDGRILSWSGDTTLRLWDAASGACLAVLEGHRKWIRGVMLLPDGRILSWGDEMLRLWDAASGVCLAILQGHTGSVNGALLLPDGRILSWSYHGMWEYDGTLRLWDAATGACLAVLKGHTDDVRGVLLLPDGRILSWAGNGDKALRLWDAATGACLAVLQGHTGQVEGALLLPDGRILSWAEWPDKTLRVWDAATGACLEVIREGEFPLRHPEMFHHKQSITRSENVAGDWCADARGRTARLAHRLGLRLLPAWQAETDCFRTPSYGTHLPLPTLLQRDGTLVVTQANNQVCILKLHHGNRRVSLAEAEEILRASGKLPQVTG